MACSRYVYIQWYISCCKFSHDWCLAPNRWGFKITHSNAPQSVGLLWTSDQSVTETSTWQHTTLTTNIHAPGEIFFWGGRYNPLWVCILQPPSGAIASSFTRFLDHIRRATVGRTPLNEWSIRHRDLYLTTHNNHNRQTSMPRVGFEPTISAGERPKPYALDRAATRIGLTVTLKTKNDSVRNSCVPFLWMKIMAVGT